MLPEKYRWVAAEFEPEGDPWVLLQIARDLEAEGNLEGAAAVYDRAYGLEPGTDRVRQARAALLDRLTLREHGLVFRYVPAGPFVMGSVDGEDDEKPRHPVWLGPYWLSETPVSWADYCRLMDWQPPPVGAPVWQTSLPRPALARQPAQTSPLRPQLLKRRLQKRLRRQRKPPNRPRPRLVRRNLPDPKTLRASWPPRGNRRSPAR